MSRSQFLEWGAVSRHPDLEEDLGYDLDEWEAVRARKYDEEMLLFLPSDEELLKVDAFVVATLDDVCDVEDHV